MQVIHLSQKELAERWRMSEATLERWRSARIGPVFLKILGRVFVATPSSKEIIQ